MIDSILFQIINSINVFLRDILIWLNYFNEF
jgi:hypothetical protein